MSPRVVASVLHIAALSFTCGIHITKKDGAPNDGAALAASRNLLTNGTAKGKGSCPTPTGTGICVQECDTDADCSGGKICCSNGCGHVCVVPTAESHEILQQCVLMVSLKNMTGGSATAKSSVDDLMRKVPGPVSRSDLRALGILILSYGKTRDQHEACCRSSRTLASDANVKYVEFDGKPPACAEDDGPSGATTAAEGRPSDGVGRVKLM
mmetsp:Transcript_70618/g.199378  ORF Transcript_70618/g.199378 Transcript_70618/m.199378 type:complete len:211 (+) Transcript_70618:49-681(+)